MAIPGSPLDTRTQGCNQLIRDGAVLVGAAQDAIELLETFTGEPRSTYRVAEEVSDFDYADLEEVDPREGAEAIAQLLSTAPIAIDELIRQSGASAASVHMALLEMELAGEIERHDGGAVGLT